MSNSVSLSGVMSASLGPDGSSPPSREDLMFTYGYNQKVDVTINFDGPVTDQPVGLNRLATDGGRVLFIRVEIGQCTVKLNNGAPLPMAAGAGDFWLANKITGWLTDLKISTTGPAKVIVRVYG